jgi:hypothetical protein
MRVQSLASRSWPPYSRKLAKTLRRRTWTAYEETSNSYEVLMGKLLGRHSENNIKMDLRDIDCEWGRWAKLVQDRVQLQPLILAVLKLDVLLPGA